MTYLQNLDLNILRSINSFFVAHSWPFLDKFFAEYLIYSIPVILVGLWFFSPKSKKVALRALLAAILAWPILAKIIAHFVHRARPFDVIGVRELIFHRPDYSFPSDHAAACFAIAFSLWLSGSKKLSYAMFAIAILISFFRVATAIHYPGDILAGFALGILAAYLIYLFDKPLDTLYNFIIMFMRKVRLA